jgi:hypothetical protein
MEALSSSETSVPTRARRRSIPEDAILHSHRRENLKSCLYKLHLTLVRNNVIKIWDSSDGTSAGHDSGQFEFDLRRGNEFSFPQDSDRL